jgi:serine/threonine-protein kinase
MSSSSDARSPVELLADEFLARYKRGEKPTIKEYCDRHPHLADDIRDVFEAVLMVEDLKPGSDDASGSSGPSAHSDGKRLEQVGDYRILCEIGRGGMGVVYEAEQQALGRRVALKVLPRTSAGDGSAQVRFQREAKAAGRMHHTNIVPVFDVGQDGDHLFYAMQLIHGQGLDLVIDDLKRLRAQSGAAPAADERAAERSIAASLAAGTFERENLAPQGEADAKATAAYEGSAPSSAVLPGQSDLSTATSNRGVYFRGVAQIGVQAAAALSYAHGRGIIHRDIKPGNLILDTTGNVWVTDFGLAKTGDGGGVTHTGDILGTLRYMAPERFRGQCDVRADVYALGMTLYELLTLKPAYTSGDRLKLIESIRQAEAASPRSIDARIPRDLETIVLKAIDKDPRRRYQSADELAEDLQRFVNDEPIQARRVGAVERLGRWCRRNPAVAGLMAAVLVLMAVGTAVSTWQAVAATRARADLAAKHDALAEEQTKVQARFELAQKAIALFHTGVSEDALLKNAEFKELRKKLLKEAAGFYADLEKLLEGQTDARSRKALAEGYFQLAELTDKIGDQKQALAVHRKALAVWRELAAVPGADMETRLDVGRSLWRMGWLLHRMGNNAEARVAHEEQRDLAEGWEALAPTDAVRLRPARTFFPEAAATETIATTDAVWVMLAGAHHSIGNVFWATAKFPEALDSFRKALAIYEKLADANPSSVFFRQSLAGTYSSIGFMLWLTGKSAEGLKVLRKASGILQKLADTNPVNIHVQDYLAKTYGNTGLVCMQTGKLAEGLEAFRKALAVFQKLTDANPAVTEFQFNLALSHEDIGHLLSKTGKPEEAMEAYFKGLAIKQKVSDANPTVPQYQRELARAHNNLGRLLARQKRFAEAFTQIDAGLAMRQKLAEADPKNTEYTNHLGFSHAYRGWALVRSGQPSKAAADLRRALELWAKEAAPVPETRFERSRALALLAGRGGEAKSGVTIAEAAMFTDLAVAALRDAISAGWGLLDELKEPDFDALRGRDDFKKLLAEVGAKAEKK